KHDGTQQPNDERQECKVSEGASGASQHRGEFVTGHWPIRSWQNEPPSIPPNTGRLVNGGPPRTPERVACSRGNPPSHLRLCLVQIGGEPIPGRRQGV